MPGTNCNRFPSARAGSLIRDYPRIRLHVEQVRHPAMQLQELFEREVDMVISPLVKVPESRVTRGITLEACSMIASP
jgi:hypothetical protein